jgi:putative ABC transport system permease protein
MSFCGTTALAFSALLRNRMRSLLTMLGIVIGVAAVLMMQSLGQGATAYVGEAISGLGSDMLLVVPGASRQMGAGAMGVPLFTLADVDAIRRGARDVDRLAAAGDRFLRVVAGANNRSTHLAGATPDYFEIRQWGTSAGRSFSREDERQAAMVCLIGHTVAAELFPGVDPIGHEMRAHNLTCRVIGTLDAKGASFGADQDDIVFLPFSTFARRIQGSERVTVILASAVSSDRLDAAREQVSSILRRRRHVLPGEEDDFAVRDPRELQALLQKVTGVLTTVLAGVAAISLIVGGIGIMNIMLVSVTERTREIGIRLAVGARSFDILNQFLVEAMTLSAMGGLAGTLLGVLGGLGLARGVHVPFVLPLRATPLALGVSVAVGIIFGVFPARKASRLNPLAALRFE